jgi:hypothetical protein
VSASCRRIRPRPLAGEPASLRLTDRQQRQLSLWSSELEAATGWHGELPVALLESCWLRLRRVPVQRLAAALPPDGSASAPELVRYRELCQGGLDSWTAQLQCWQDFGSEAFQQAQLRFWQQQERGNHGWTLGRYLGLVERYRHGLAPEGRRELPLLRLARQGSEDAHQLFWLPAGRGPIGHTCA